jgi:hypothetical protein
MLKNVPPESETLDEAVNAMWAVVWSISLTCQGPAKC